MEVGRRFPAGGRPVLGVRCMGFGWVKYVTVHGSGGCAMGETGGLLSPATRGGRRRRQTPATGCR